MICREAVGRAGIRARSTPQSILQTLPSCCVHSKICSGYFKDFSNRWKVKVKWVQSAGCHDSEHRNRGSRKLSCKNTVWEDSAICQVWVGEKLFRALQDAQLRSVPEFAIDFRLCKKWKLPAICVKGLLRVHKEKRSLRQSLNMPWSQSGLSTSKRSLILPTRRSCSAGTVCDTPLGHSDGFTSTNLYVLWWWHLLNTPENKVRATLHHVVPDEPDGEMYLQMIQLESALNSSNYISKLKHSIELKTKGTFMVLPSNELLQILECVQANFLNSCVFKCISSLFV